MPEPRELTIYDVFRNLVDAIVWKNEYDVRRMHHAINVAEENRLFRTEGDMRL